MITSGLWIVTATTEIIDVVNEKTCSNLAKFPVQSHFAAVGANLHGNPVVCGGSGGEKSSDKCYQFTLGGGWQEFASMKDRREHAAGFMYREKNKWYVFGGLVSVAGSFTDVKRLQTSEIMEHGGVWVDGPKLQTLVSHHAITVINAEVSILSGGVILDILAWGSV